MFLSPCPDLGCAMKNLSVEHVRSMNPLVLLVKEFFYENFNPPFTTNSGLRHTTHSALPAVDPQSLAINLARRCP